MASLVTLMIPSIPEVIASSTMYESLAYSQLAAFLSASNFREVGKKSHENHQL